MPVVKGASHKLARSITEKTIAAVKPGKTKFEEKLSGFGVRCYRSGEKVFIVATTVAANTKSGRAAKWMTIGPASGPRALPIPDARERATRILAELHAVGATTHDLTLRVAIAKYQQKATLSARTRKDVGDMLRLHCREWLDRRLTDIDPLDVQAKYYALLPTEYEKERANKLGKPAPSPAKANFVMSALRSVWTTALKTLKFPGGQPPRCPTHVLDGERLPNGVRETYLDDAALTQLGANMRGYRGQGAYCAYLLMLLLNGMRAREPSKILWVWKSEQSFKIAAHETKQRKLLEVPMTPANAAIFDYMDTLRGKLGPADYVFASAVTKAEMRCARYIGDQLLPKRYKLHDLRRTFKRHARQLDVPEYIVEALLGHVAVKNANNMSGRYDPQSVADRAVLLAQVQDKLLAKLGGLAGLLPVQSVLPEGRAAASIAARRVETVPDVLRGTLDTTVPCS